MSHDLYVRCININNKILNFFLNLLFLPGDVKILFNKGLPSKRKNKNWQHLEMLRIGSKTHELLGISQLCFPQFLEMGLWWAILTLKYSGFLYLMHIQFEDINLLQVLSFLLSVTSSQEMSG